MKATTYPDTHKKRKEEENESNTALEGIEPYHCGQQQFATTKYKVQSHIQTRKGL
jgi:hypothetical protein